MPETQLTNRVLMIRPVRFESNPQTAGSNSFQGRIAASPAGLQAAASQEFEQTVADLRESGIDVAVVDDTTDPHTPDSIFPNNWISFHADGSVVLYPMQAENRRAERRLDVLDAVQGQVRDVVDLSHHEKDGHYLEGTGSLVLDRVNRIAYACLSPRTHLDPLGDFAQRMGYEVVAFDAVDRQGTPVYHTNVMMNVGEELAVVCDASIVRSEQREAVMRRLNETGHEVLSLSMDQLEAYAGNMLELRDRRGERLVVMSHRAHASLSKDQLEQLEKNGRIGVFDVSTIEDAAGGSVRCMMAEVHLPQGSQGTVRRPV